MPAVTIRTSANGKVTIKVLNERVRVALRSSSIGQLRIFFMNNLGERLLWMRTEKQDIYRKNIKRNVL